MIKLITNQVQISIWGKSPAQDLQKHPDEKISSLETLWNMSDGKCRREKNYPKSKILEENFLLVWVISFWWLDHKSFS